MSITMHSTHENAISHVVHSQEKKGTRGYCLYERKIKAMSIQRESLLVGDRRYAYYPVAGIEGIEKLPFSLTILVENILRNVSDETQAKALVSRILEAGLAGNSGDEVEFLPARVLFQDFTGVPVFVDFAVMREACEALGGDPASINPQIPCDLVIDHSIIADTAGCSDCLAKNAALEYERNTERYEFLKWAQQSFENVRIVPPGQGICHQLNIEAFASVVMTKEAGDGENIAYFDTLVGTDSHTPTANGIGVLGWGVGGIEAEAAALGQPITTLVPRVVGIRMTGALQPGVMAMDVALTVAARLRERGVVGAFVECFGEGVKNLSATQRTCIANMTPEYGCTCTLFPVDDQTLDYLRLTGRDEETVELIKAYMEVQGVWGRSGEDCIYSEVIDLDLSKVTVSAAGPSRPHDLVAFSGIQNRFRDVSAERGLDLDKRVAVDVLGAEEMLGHGAIAIAAVTSCTTATDPAMMVQAGVFARNAAQAGLRPKPWVKTILAPGSHATDMLLEQAGLKSGLEELGFYTAGFGCMSCIGNSGPLMESMHAVASDIELASVLSGNRNFEGRISPDVSQNYLMAPADVIAFSLAGTVDFDFETTALGVGNDGEDVYLRDIVPDPAEVAALVAEFATPELYRAGMEGLYDGDETWASLEAGSSNTFAWDENSTYVRHAPYFDGMTREPNGQKPIENARVLGYFGDFITTDHISPAGAIATDMPAADYLQEHGVAVADFNTYGARRGNHEVMMRGTFANVKLQNILADGKRGGWTRNFANDAIDTIYATSQAYANAGDDVIVLAGKMYGSGSSRDWAAKGPMLLGVRAVIAESYERIHRSNLIGMGILPLQFLEGQSAQSLGLEGNERYTVDPVDVSAGLPANPHVTVRAVAPDGNEITFEAQVRIDTPTEGYYYHHGGILPYVLRNLSA